MDKNPGGKNQKKPGNSKLSAASATDDTLHQLAFDNSIQPSIISTTQTGKIVAANSAACKLLAYSQKALLTKNRADIFAITEASFKKILKQRTATGHSEAMVTVIKKSGKTISCSITSAVFLDEHGIEKSITTITDMSKSILEQKNIDIEKEKIVADNIVIAQSRQDKIDIKKEKIVADNIVIAQSRQEEIDIKKEKIVADNIVLAKSKQKKIDIKKEKIVADNIVLAKSKQKKIDIKKEKIVADNIVLAQEKSDARLAKNNEWIKYIAKSSYDVMWDWDIITGEIYIGDSIEEVFGYKAQNNLAKFSDFIDCLLPKEKDIVEKKLLKSLLPGNKSWKDSFMFKRHDGSVASTTSRASIVRDEAGKAIRLIGAIQDVSRLEELEKKLEEQASIQAEQSEKLFLAAKLSFDVIWDWNLETDDIFIGEWFEELFGYTVKNNKGDMSAVWGNYLYPEDRSTVEEGLTEAIESSATHWEHAYRFIRADGSIATVFNRASIIRRADGKAYRMIGAMQDISKQKILEEKLEQEIASREKLLREYDENFKLIFNSSADILYDIDLKTRIARLSNAYEKEFGYKILNDTTPEEELLSHIHPDDKEALIADYKRMLASDEIEWNYNFRFLKADNTVANLSGSGIVLRNAAGKAYRRIGYLHDMSKQQALEERLEKEIRLKEKQIAEAMEDAKEAERSHIGKELHDNINQLLSASKMYLEMAKRGGDNSKMYLSRSSQYTLEAIEEIRKLTRGLTTDIIKNLGLCESIEKLVSDTMEVNQVKITCVLDSFEERDIPDKFKLNLYRIMQEQLNNILKHSKATDVTIALIQNDTNIILTISDNGVGFDTTKKRKGIGIDNIKSRATAYSGIAEFISHPGEGCNLAVTFAIGGTVN